MEIWVDESEPEYENRKMSPHWPNIGRYIGVVDDEKPILFDTGEDFSCFDFYDKYDYQRRRIYLDEVPRPIKRYGESIPEKLNEIMDYFLEEEKKEIEIDKFIWGKL